MKRSFCIFVSIFIFTINSFSQNITNTLGENGVYSVKDNASTFFSISQSSGTVSLGKNFDIPNTSGSDIGVILKSGVYFMHNYGTNNLFIGNNTGNFTLTGSKNTAVGIISLNINSTGYQNTSLGYFALAANSTGYDNTAIGQFSLRANSSGMENTAVGSFSLRTNTLGERNSAFGTKTLYSNTSGLANSAFGTYALYSNTTGDLNCAYGSYSLYSNTDGGSNSAFGEAALEDNLLGFSNSAFGRGALSANTNGDYNTAIGSSALTNNLNGNYNTTVGNSAGSAITGSNNIAIGYNAQVPNANFSNQVVIGNSNIGYAGIKVSWTITSDRRWKNNIQTTTLGLDFISKLNPVSYLRNNDDMHRTEFGLIAQELEEVLKEFKIENTGMLTIDDKGYYHLRYNDLLSPLIKAIQELKLKNEELKKQNEDQIAKLNKGNIELKEKLAIFEQTQKILIKEIAGLKINNSENVEITLSEIK